MRQIKFRAWDKQDKRMIVDEQDFIPLLVTSKGVFRLNPHYEFDLYNRVDTERFELMQFTGLLDKNGKEIYEGDIIIAHELSANYPLNYIIVFNEIDTGFRMRWEQRYKDKNGTGFYDEKISAVKYKRFEVIGNIYETTPVAAKTQ